MNTVGLGFNAFLSNAGLSQDAPSPFARWLDRQGLTWHQVHRRTGLAKSTCHDFWRGLHQPSPKSLKRIADAYNLSYESLAV